MNDRYLYGLLLLVLALGLHTRLVGLDRGWSDCVPPARLLEGQTRHFHHFHPDEETLLRAALALDSPLEPPLTAYGMLPLYLLRGGLEALVLLCGWNVSDLEDPQAAHRAYTAARALSALLSLASLGLLFGLGRALFGPWQGALAALFLAAAPAAIQQAHFFTVDGLYAFLCLAFFALALRALDSERPGWYLACGLLVGAAGAVRLNGLLLGAVLLAGHLARRGGVRGLRSPPLWLAGLAAVLALLLLQPFLLLDPALLWRAESTDDLGFSLKVARGEILRPWTLADVHTLPYLHYLSHLLPLAAGWPLALAALAGAAHALWQRRGGLLLLWCGLYFAQVGILHTKHVRYLLPILPFLCLLAGDLVLALQRRRALAGRVLGALLVLGTGVYGLAFASIYTREDSRLQAARYVQAQVPPGRLLGVERGGFSMEPLVGGPGRPTRPLNTTPLFDARGLMTCRAAAAYLEDRLQGLEWIALVDVNRARQFAAAPDLFPATSSFYNGLLAGELGFRVAARFKHYPSFLGLVFRDDGAEPSFLGYDHPAVYVLEREKGAGAALARWRAGLEEDPHCPDPLLQEVSAALRQDDVPRADSLLARLEAQYPQALLARLLEAELRRRQGDTAAEAEANRHYREGLRHRSAHVVPWAVGEGLVDLDLPDLALAALTEAALKSPHMPGWTVEEMGRAFALLANRMYDRGYAEHAREAYRLSVQLHPTTAAYNRLAFLCYRAEDYRLAAEFWSRSVRLDDGQAGIHANLGQVTARHLRDYERALYHLQRAMELDPDSRAELQGWVNSVSDELDRQRD